MYKPRTFSPTAADLRHLKSLCRAEKERVTKDILSKILKGKPSGHLLSDPRLSEVSNLIYFYNFVINTKDLKSISDPFNSVELECPKEIRDIVLQYQSVYNF